MVFSGSAVSVNAIWNDVIRKQIVRWQQCLFRMKNGSFGLWRNRLVWCNSLSSGTSNVTKHWWSLIPTARSILISKFKIRWHLLGFESLKFNYELGRSRFPFLFGIWAPIKHQNNLRNLSNLAKSLRIVFDWLKATKHPWSYFSKFFWDHILDNLRWFLPNWKIK